jgi:hypothetical protein
MDAFQEAIFEARCAKAMHAIMKWACQACSVAVARLATSL